MAAYPPGAADDYAARRDATVFELPGVGRKRVVSVKLEQSIIEEIDRVWRELGYTSRSQFIREAIIYYMLIARALRGGENLCVCRCSETPEAKRLEDYLAERLAEYVGENLEEMEDMSLE